MFCTKLYYICMIIMSIVKTKIYIDEINIKVNQKFSMSSLILDNNYYKKLGIK